MTNNEAREKRAKAIQDLWEVHISTDWMSSNREQYKRETGLITLLEAYDQLATDQWSDTLQRIVDTSLLLDNAMFSV